MVRILMSMEKWGSRIFFQTIEDFMEGSERRIVSINHNVFSGYKHRFHEFDYRARLNIDVVGMIPSYMDSFLTSNE